MKKQKPKESEVVQSIMDSFQSFTDPLGMWTGKPADEEDVPVQDADDL